ncbi:MAG: MTH938/NDUFAF3 family protein [Woeseiaceae bacterium]|nr:MTH938/NDUFAF3 family protein [Woeseiaceae bacterium]
MKFTREEASLIAIRGVSEDGFSVGREVLSGTIALTGESIVSDWEHKPLELLVESDFGVLLDTEPEVVIVGTGRTQLFPPRELTFAFARRGTGLEVMDSRAAARTFNVLVGEGRRVAAILYPV